MIETASSSDTQRSPINDGQQGRAQEVSQSKFHG